MDVISLHDRSMLGPAARAGARGAGKASPPRTAGQHLESRTCAVSRTRVRAADPATVDCACENMDLVLDLGRKL